jgi:Putative zinc-finger
VTSPADHVDVAAYVLGALDEPEKFAFERHLAGCPRCQAELDELAGLPALLDQVRDSELLADLLVPMPPAEDKVLRGVLVDVASARRKRKRVGLLVAAAAAVLIIAGPLVAIGVSGGFGGSGSSTAQAEMVTATNPANNVAVKLALTPTSWGTKVGFDLTGVRGPLNCVLYAVDRNGDKFAAASWSVSATGYGVPGSPDALHIDGGVGLQRSDIARFEFARDNGPDILSVKL